MPNLHLGMFVPLKGLKTDSPYIWWGFDKKTAGRPHLFYPQVKVLRVSVAVRECPHPLCALSTRRLQFTSVGGTQLAPAEEALSYLDEVKVMRGDDTLIKTFVAFRQEGETVCPRRRRLACTGTQRDCRCFDSIYTPHTQSVLQEAVHCFASVSLCTVHCTCVGYVPQACRRSAGAVSQCHVRPAVSTSTVSLPHTAQPFNLPGVLVLPSHEALCAPEGAQRILNWKKDNPLIGADLAFEIIDPTNIVGIHKPASDLLEDDDASAEKGPRHFVDALKKTVGVLMKVELDKAREETQKLTNEARSAAQKVCTRPSRCLCSRVRCLCYCTQAHTAESGKVVKAKKPKAPPGQAKGNNHSECGVSKSLCQFCVNARRQGKQPKQAASGPGGTPGAAPGVGTPPTPVNAQQQQSMFQQFQQWQHFQSMFPQPQQPPQPQPFVPGALVVPPLPPPATTGDLGVPPGLQVGDLGLDLGGAASQPPPLDGQGMFVDSPKSAGHVCQDSPVSGNGADTGA